MRTATTVAGIICILIVLLDAFQTVILPVVPPVVSASPGSSTSPRGFPGVR